MRSHPPEERHSVGSYRVSLFGTENHPKGGQPLATARGLPVASWSQIVGDRYETLTSR